MLSLSLVILVLLTVSASLTVVLEGDSSVFFFTLTGIFLGAAIINLGQLLLGIMQFTVFAGLGVFTYFYERWEI